MRKVHFLLTLLALLVIGCRHNDHRDHDHHSPDPTTTLKVVLNGPYVIVWTQSRPDVITVFSPRDNQGLHRFYSNNLTEGVDQNVHLRLAAEGLKPAAKLLIDPYFPQDFVVNTDVWQRPSKSEPGKDYLVTIELPLPEKITYMSPLHPVTFDDGTQSYQATNFVLEYQVTDLGKIRTSHGSNSVSPLSSSDLQKQYDGLCGDTKNRKYYESCANLRNLLEQCAGAKTVVFFFGVGIPLGVPADAEAHAVDFFNNVILQSFPKWNGPRLAPKGAVAPRGVGGSTPMLKGAFAPLYPGGSTPMLMEASFSPVVLYPRLHPITAVTGNGTAVIDCKAGNVIVTAKTTQ